MAKLTMTLDTETQELSVSVDGQDIDAGTVSELNVSNWSCGDDPKFSFCVTSMEKVGGVHKLIRLMAKKSPEAEEAASAGIRLEPSKAIDGMVQTPGMTKVQLAVSAWHKSRRV